MPLCHNSKLVWPGCTAVRQHKHFTPNRVATQHCRSEWSTGGTDEFAVPESSQVHLHAGPYGMKSLGTCRGVNRRTGQPCNRAWRGRAVVRGVGAWCVGGNLPVSARGRFRAKREQLKRGFGLLSERQGPNMILALTVVYVPYSLDSDPRVCLVCVSGRLDTGYLYQGKSDIGTLPGTDHARALRPVDCSGLKGRRGVWNGGGCRPTEAPSSDSHVKKSVVKW